MSNRPPNERGPGVASQERGSPYNRAQTQSPGSVPARPGPYYIHDPRYIPVTTPGYAVYQHYNTQPQAGDRGGEYRTDQPGSIDPHTRRRPMLLPPSTRIGLEQYPYASLERITHYPGAAGRPPGDGGGQHPGSSGGGVPPQASHGLAQHQVAMPTQVADLGPHPKRIRLSQDVGSVTQPLRIDTEARPHRESYNPQVEAISPTLPDERPDTSNRAPKDDIINNIHRVDREISKAEQQVSKLQKKKQQLEEKAARPADEKAGSPESTVTDSKHQSTAQNIYAENRKKAEESHSLLTKLGPCVELPLYNQPSDTTIYHENKRRHMMFKKQLLIFLKKRHHARKIRERYLAQRYDQLMQEWLKKVEKSESTQKRRNKEQKNREFFERTFPELKKQREEKERLQRVGGYARSDFEIEQIVDGLHEQEVREEDKKMRSYAVVPPMLMDPQQRNCRFLDHNGLIEDSMTEHKERQMLNVWTDSEKETFKEKYLQHPKNFVYISSFLERKSVQDCVRYYYLSKKRENYKQLLRKQSVKKRKFPRPQGAIKQEEPKENKDPIDELPVPIITPQEKQRLEEERNAQTSQASSGSQGNVTTSNSSSLLSNAPLPSALQDGVISRDNDTAESGGAHQCASCKSLLEHFGLSRPLTKGNCELYGISEESYTMDMRICSNCRCQSVRRRYAK